MSEDDETVLRIAEELYGLAPAEFTPARDARAKELKGTAAGARVKALRKPSVAAWVVNQLVRHETEQIDQVLAVGAELRAAQASMSGDELRALTRQRRQLTAAVTTRARTVARGLGVRVTESVADQVEATLTAAILEEACGAAVRSGLLVSALAATGVDPVDLAAAVATPEALGFQAAPAAVEPAPRAELYVVADPDADAKAREAARARLATVEAELADAEAALVEATRVTSDLQARELQAQAEIDELRLRLAELEAHADEVEEELAAAEESRGEAEEVRDAARAARDAASANLDRLGS